MKSLLAYKYHAIYNDLSRPMSLFSSVFSFVAIIVVNVYVMKGPVRRCGISPIRIRNECHFFASVDIRRKCVSCQFDPLTGRSSSGNLCCLCVLFLSFVNVIRFSCVKRHSCESCDRPLKPGHTNAV